MIKRTPSRTQRSKGINGKHVLQICLLLGVCFWLIYQVKHSHDKKKEFDDKDSKVSVKARSGDEILKLGRKDLPQAQEATKNERHEDEEEDAIEEEENKPEEEEIKVTMREEEEERDAVEDQEEANKQDEDENEDGENKLEAEEQEEENKNEEEPEEAGSKLEDERRGGGDDELDEQDQERTEGEAVHVDEFIDEEKEREGEGDDRESKGIEGEEKNGRVENENSLDDHAHEGVDRNTHVAREEHYKADDASSAVSHDNQIITSETERNVLEDENKSNTTNEIGGNQKNMELKLGEGEMAESGSTSNGTITEEKDHGAGSYNYQGRSSLTSNSTSVEGGTRVSNNSTGLSTEMTVSSVRNGTETKLDANPNPAQNVIFDGETNRESTDLQTTGFEKANNLNTASNGNQFDSNTTISTKTYSFNNSAPALPESVIRLNAIADGEVNPGSSARNEIANTTQNETSNSKGESGGTKENSDSSTTEGTMGANSDNESGETNESSDSFSMNEIVEVEKEDLIDSSDSTIRLDEKESRIDLGTLPDIKAEVENSEEAAEE